MSILSLNLCVKYDANDIWWSKHILSIYVLSMDIYISSSCCCTSFSNHPSIHTVLISIQKDWHNLSILLHSMTHIKSLSAKVSLPTMAGQCTYCSVVYNDVTYDMIWWYELIQHITLPSLSSWCTNQLSQSSINSCHNIIISLLGLGVFSYSYEIVQHNAGRW